MDLIRKMTNEYNDYLRDESRIYGHAESISFPKTEEELIKIVKHCYDNNILINVQGARTGLAAGASPAGGHILNLSRMNSILGMRFDKETGKYYLRIQPGVLLIQVRKALEEKNFNTAFWSDESLKVLKQISPGELFFAPDPTEPTASIGGNAACNASGSRSLLYGAVREHIIAMRVVLANGSAASLHRGGQKAKGRSFTLTMEDGKVIKGLLPDLYTPRTKDAGYYFHEDMDLLDLFIGSQGTLGIISELEIRLEPTPKHMWGLTAFLPDDYASINYVRILRGESLPNMPVFPYKPAALELFDKNTLEKVLQQKEKTPSFQRLQELPEVFSSAVYVEFNENTEDTFWQILSAVSDILLAVGGNPDNTWVANGPRALEKLVFFRHTVPETADLIREENRKKDPSLKILSADMAVPDDYILDVYNMYRNDLLTRAKHWMIFGHIGENHYHPAIFPETKDEYEEGVRIFSDWAKKVTEWGGTITAEHGTGKVKKDLAKIMYGEENIKEIKRFKALLDDKMLLGPDNIL